MLSAPGAQQLRADADAEERLAASSHRAVQSVDHARDSVQTAPAIGESADARKNDMIGVENVVWTRGHQHVWIQARLARCAFKRLLRRMQISGAVVNDRDRHDVYPYNAPLVEGTRSA